MPTRSPSDASVVCVVSKGLADEALTLGAVTAVPASIVGFVAGMSETALVVADETCVGDATGTSNVGVLEAVGPEHADISSPRHAVKQTRSREVGEPRS